MRIFRTNPDVQAARADLAEYMANARRTGDLNETSEFAAANQAVVDAEARARARRTR